MATYWVYSGSGGAGDAAGKGTDPTTPFATLKYCMENANGMGAAPANGDIVYVDYRHVETSATSWSIDLTSEANYLSHLDGIHIVSADFGATPASTYKKMTSSDGNIGVSSTATFSLIATGFDSNQECSLRWHWHGIRFLGGQNLLNTSDPMHVFFKDCIFEKTTGSGTFIRPTHDVMIYIDSCTVNQSATTGNKFIAPSSTAGLCEVHIRDSTLQSENMFYSEHVAAFQVMRAVVEDSNLTDVTYIQTISFGSDPSALVATSRLRRCKMSADVSTYVFSNNGLLPCRQEFLVQECSNADITATPDPVTRYQSGSGEITTDRSVYYTSAPGSDGEANYSLKFTPTTTCNRSFNLGGAVPFSAWHPGGNANLTVRFCSNDATLTDEDVWLEVSSPGHTTDTGSATIGRFTDTRPAFGAGAVADTSTLLLTDTDASWTGGGTSEYKFVVPINATEPGSVDITFHFGKSSTTPLWVSTNVSVA